MWPTTSRQHPERRRALVIGAGPTGMSVAFHLGEHSLLLERRDSLEHQHDYSHDLPMGSAHGGVMGGEDPGADRARFAEAKTLFISCSSRTHADAGEHTLIHVERWQPPAVAPLPEPDEPGAPPSVRTLRPLLRGELRMGAHVVRVSPSSHLVELADGHRIVYDKLVSTLSLAANELLVASDLPPHVRLDETLRYWLSEHDIEVADRDTQDHYGDLDEFAAGKRIADQVGHALAAKFGNRGRSKLRGTRLFEPRLVAIRP
jgi:hypothetical protein